MGRTVTEQLLIELQSFATSQHSAYRSLRFNKVCLLVCCCTYSFSKPTTFLRNHVFIHRLKIFRSVCKISSFRCSTPHVMLHKIFISTASVLLAFTYCTSLVPLTYKTMRICMTIGFMWIHRISVTLYNFSPLYSFAVLLMPFTSSYIVSYWRTFNTLCSGLQLPKFLNAKIFFCTVT